MSRTALASALIAISLFAADASFAAGPPGPTVINGRKVLTLISRDPPALRCNNNIQVAAELSNVYKVPVVVVPVTFAGPGAKAPAVYYGGQLIAVDGGEQNGMIDFVRMSDVMEIEDVPKQDKPGRLLEVKKEYDALRQAIRTLP
jgi:hypothetical protein